MSKKFPIIENAKRQARMIFVGIAIPCDLSTVDGKTIRGEKVLKFNRKILRNASRVRKSKIDSRYNGGDDTMIVAVGRPGSRERVDALSNQYAAVMASGEEVSPFSWEG